MVVFVAIGSEEAAEKPPHPLQEQRRIARANIMPRVYSPYRQEGLSVS